jgi:hypothetical protein
MRIEEESSGEEVASSDCIIHGKRVAQARKNDRFVRLGLEWSGFKNEFLLLFSFSISVMPANIRATVVYQK